ncbi:hypothetical protein [Sorangium sp. So ce131]|uniref:hypothetical protein n=1 Tax=Sorangium sp. So ce131 TaxID=3133282 RepID=UPI003F5DC14B
MLNRAAAWASRRIERPLSWLELRERHVVGVCIALLLIAGLVYSLRLGDALRYYDEREYFKIASYLADRGEYTLNRDGPTAFRPPGYPALIAALLLSGAGVVLIRFANFVLLAGSLLLTHHLVKRAAGVRAGLIAVGLALAYPVFFYTAGTLYPQTVAAFLLVLSLALLFRGAGAADPAPLPRGAGRARLWSAALAGVAMGALTLVVPTFLFLLPLLFLLLWPDLRSAVVAAAALVAVVGAWSVRNYLAFDSFVLVSSNSGLNFLLGNSEQATGGSGVNVDISHHLRDAAAAGLNEIERDAYLRSQGVRYVLENKLDALGLYFSKVLHYFAFRNQLATEGEGAGWQDLVMLATYGPLLLLFVARLALFRRFPLLPLEKRLVAIYVASAFAHAVFFSRIRFRLPLDLLLIAVDAIFLARLLGQRAPGPEGPAPA